MADKTQKLINAAAQKIKALQTTVRDLTEQKSALANQVTTAKAEVASLKAQLQKQKDAKHIEQLRADKLLRENKELKAEKKRGAARAAADESGDDDESKAPGGQKKRQRKKKDDGPNTPRPTNANPSTVAAFVGDAGDKDFDVSDEDSDLGAEGAGGGKGKGVL